jgi:hypothetical protein
MIEISGLTNTPSSTLAEAGAKLGILRPHAGAVIPAPYAYRSKTLIKLAVFRLVGGQHFQEV